MKENKFARELTFTIFINLLIFLFASSGYAGSLKDQIFKELRKFNYQPLIVKILKQGQMQSHVSEALPGQIRESIESIVLAKIKAKCTEGGRVFDGNVEFPIVLNKWNEWELSSSPLENELPLCAKNITSHGRINGVECHSGCLLYITDNSGSLLKLWLKTGSSKDLSVFKIGKDGGDLNQSTGSGYSYPFDSYLNQKTLDYIGKNCECVWYSWGSDDSSNSTKVIKSIIIEP